MEIPSERLLAGYVAALRTGWSPSNVADLSGLHLAAIDSGPAAFLAQYDASPGGPVRLPDGTTRTRLPGQLFWISDGSFCGFMSFRYQQGTADLPEHVSGHVGYGVVPWKRRQGVATAALLALLPIAAAAGLQRVLITAATANVASQRVILAVGGVPAAVVLPPDAFGPRLGFWVPTSG